MTYDYILINIKAVTNEYLAKVYLECGIHKKDLTLVYKISDDKYYTSLFSTQIWDELTCKTQELVCETQEEFINTVAQHKLERLL